LEVIVEKVGRWLGGRLDDIRGFIGTLYAGQLHAKRSIPWRGRPLA
jgi:hypothetical protein